MFSSRASAPACSICRAYVVQPPNVDAVQAADDRDPDGRFRLRDVLEIRFRADLELGALGKIAQRLRVTFRPLIEIITAGRGDRAESAPRRANGTRWPKRRRLPFA